MTKGHALVLPKEHFDNLYELPGEWCKNAFALAQKMAVQMTEKLSCDGFNLLQNNKEAAGQTISHFHIHLVPRYRADGLELSGEQQSPTQEELEAVRKQLI